MWSLAINSVTKNKPERTTEKYVNDAFLIGKARNTKSHLATALSMFMINIATNRSLAHSFLSPYEARLCEGRNPDADCHRLTP
jgi:hypothetical protein